MSKNNLRDNRENISRKYGLSPSNFNSPPNNKEHNSIPSNRFYTEKEEVTLRFYQVPKALFKNPIYEGLSLGSKLMYSILRDRLDMSIKNNWKDEKGYIYLIFSGEELINLLEVSKNTVTKYKRELVKHRLIINKRLGQGKSNMIYVLKPEIKEFLNPKNWESRIPKNTLLESQKIHPNDTNVNDPNLNNVNTAGRGEVVGNSKGEIKEIVTEDEEDINDIRSKIKESLKENGKCNFTELENSGKERKLSENNSDPKGRYSKDSKEGEYPGPRRYRSRETELLAKEIAEELGDNHSLGAFHAVVDKISEQQIRIFLSIIKDTYLTGKIKKSRGAMFISLAKVYTAKNNINLNFR
ncbi:MAG: replication initiator protein A [Methanomassiliicoccales archaeon]|nr:replication initiator protein A [Methanomassiliicoccales archaeon]